MLLNAVWNWRHRLQLIRLDQINLVITLQDLVQGHARECRRVLHGLYRLQEDLWLFIQTLLSIRDQRLLRTNPNCIQHCKHNTRHWIQYKVCIFIVHQSLFSFLNKNKHFFIYPQRILMLLVRLLTL
jgi:hypothetical protein